MAKRLAPDEERLFYEALSQEQADWAERQYQAFLASGRAKGDAPLLMSKELLQWLIENGLRNPDFRR
jgi:hypothetical protein